MHTYYLVIYYILNEQVILLLENIAKKCPSIMSCLWRIRLLWLKTA